MPFFHVVNAPKGKREFREIPREHARALLDGRSRDISASLWELERNPWAQTQLDNGVLLWAPKAPT